MDPETLKERIKERIKASFANVEYPGDWSIHGTDEGEEGFDVENEFKGKINRYDLPATFLDQAPDGLSSALCFFSDEAFRFYLPAYLIADIDGKLEFVSLTWRLCRGLDDGSRDQRVNPQRYGDRTLWDSAIHEHSMFNREQASVIVDYLSLVRDRDEEQWLIDQALRNYWLARSGRRVESG